MKSLNNDPDFYTSMNTLIETKTNKIDPVMYGSMKLSGNNDDDTHTFPHSFINTTSFINNSNTSHIWANMFRPNSLTLNRSLTTFVTIYGEIPYTPNLNGF